MRRVSDDENRAVRNRQATRARSAQPTKSSAGRVSRKGMLNLRFGAHCSGRAAYPSLNR